VVTVSFENWNRGDMFPRGALVATLGAADDFAAERAGLEVMASPFYSHKAFMGLPLHAAPPSGRELLAQESGWTVFNIDPEGCRDIDDCIALRDDEIAICIADVDAAVPAASRLDEYASLTAQTIYHEGAAVRPMLPPVLSEGICSLVAGAVRPSVALRATIRDGALVNVRFQPVNIINGRSYTYEEAQEGLKEALGPLMAALDCKEDDSHIWVAATMTRYNLEAAKVLMAAGHGLLRAHSGPKAERLAALTTLGPEVAARLASEAATYCLVAAGKVHAGFGDQPYCHATSPIRRYADLVNQRVLKGTTLVAAQHELVYTLNVRGKAAKEYERACAFMKALQAPIKVVDIISVGGGHAYVPAWGKLIKYDGPSGPVRYFYDATKARWKERIVFENINK
jgi:exoribonuclease R